MRLSGLKKRTREVERIRPISTISTATTAADHGGAPSASLNNPANEENGGGDVNSDMNLPPSGDGFVSNELPVGGGRNEENSNVDESGVAPSIFFRLSSSHDFQGPYTEEQMQGLYREGQFHSEVQFRFGDEGKIVSLATLRNMNGPACPFAPLKKVPTEEHPVTVRKINRMQRQIDELTARNAFLTTTLKETNLEMLNMLQDVYKEFHLMNSSAACPQLESTSNSTTTPTTIGQDTVESAYLPATESDTIEPASLQATPSTTVSDTVELTPLPAARSTIDLDTVESTELFLSAALTTTELDTVEPTPLPAAFTTTDSDSVELLPLSTTPTTTGSRTVDPAELYLPAAPNAIESDTVELTPLSTVPTTTFADTVQPVPLRVAVTTRITYALKPVPLRDALTTTVADTVQPAPIEDLAEFPWINSLDLTEEELRANLDPQEFALLGQKNELPIDEQASNEAWTEVVNKRLRLHSQPVSDDTQNGGGLHPQIHAILGQMNELPIGERASKTEWTELRLKYKTNDRQLYYNPELFPQGSRISVDCPLCDVNITSKQSVLEHVLGKNHQERALANTSKYAVLFWTNELSKRYEPAVVPSPFSLPVMADGPAGGDLRARICAILGQKNELLPAQQASPAEWEMMEEKFKTDSRKPYSIQTLFPEGGVIVRCPLCNNAKIAPERSFLQHVFGRKHKQNNAIARTSGEAVAFWTKMLSKN